ncbi:efflux RND transporter periplasmic adaptor subunit [Marinilabiliaceae bacterium ANBcel2]|nr:efflux RND transporter periplasmic adaptor subunit [Marinilabiliaceae bacterium ANBcel2]
MVSIKVIKTVSAILILAIITITTSCSQQKEEKEKRRVVKSRQSVAIEPLLTKTYPARIRSSSDINLAFRVAGPIEKVLVKEGDMVKKGELLAIIDQRDYLTQKRAASAVYNEIKQEASRIESLYQQGRVSDSEYDKIVSGLMQAKSKYESAVNALNDTRLKAPFTGEIEKLWFKQGEITDAGTPVVSMSNPADSEIITHIPVSDYFKRESFKSFSCSPSHNPDSIYELELLNITAKANLNGLHTAYFKESSKSKEVLLPGMSAEISITYKYKDDTKKLYRVPSTALFKNDESSAVWEIDKESSRLIKIPVDIIKIESSGIAIVSGNLTKESKIVSAGVNSLKEGEKVTEMEKPSKSNVGNLL